MEQIKRETIGEIVRKRESDFINGHTQVSKHVRHSMNDTIETIYAYLNSAHTSGEFDSKGREKPFFNIVVAAANIWYRATDIDRRHIKTRATKKKDWINSFLANILIQSWMRKENFGQFLNEWGRVLARFGSAVIKTVENSTGLHLIVVPWSKLIVDSVDFENNVKIEILELTEAQLRANKTYDQLMIDDLLNAKTTRKTSDKRAKDNRNDYYKLYEVHGLLPLSNLTDDVKDEDVFVQQMHVISFIGKKMKEDKEDFTLYRGKERFDPYTITHLIKEDDRTLSIGSVQNLFQAQWMQNHSVKAIKDQLDLASKLIFQTADANFVGMNALESIEQGDILIHGINQPLTQVPNNSHDIVQWQNFSTQWKTLGNEINGVSESMLGAQPKSGTAWRQTEAILQENYNLFELMTENKGLQLENLFRERIIPHLKKKIDTTEEISEILASHDIDRIDGMYIKSLSTKAVNDKIKKALFSQDISQPLDPILSEEGQELELAKERADIKESLDRLGNQRFFKPSEISTKTWKEQLKDYEWDMEIDITGESQNVQEALTTLNTALQVVMNPAFENNPKAKRIVGKTLELTGAMSPIEYGSMESPQPQPEVQGQDGSTNVSTPQITSEIKNK